MKALGSGNFGETFIAEMGSGKAKKVTVVCKVSKAAGGAGRDEWYARLYVVERCTGPYSRAQMFCEFPRFSFHGGRASWFSKANDGLK